MAVKQVRVSEQAKDQLVWLKRKTGIDQWNTLCRWALCVSLREGSVPSPVEIPVDSNVEMSWHVFGGENHEIYASLVKERCVQDGLEPTDEVVAQQFKLHLHRGISYLATPNETRSIVDLVGLAANKSRRKSTRKRGGRKQV